MSANGNAPSNMSDMDSQSTASDSSREAVALHTPYLSLGNNSSTDTLTDLTQIPPGIYSLTPLAPTEGRAAPLPPNTIGHLESHIFDSYIYDYLINPRGNIEDTPHEYIIEVLLPHIRADEVGVRGMPCDTSGRHFVIIDATVRYCYPLTSSPQLVPADRQHLHQQRRTRRVLRGIREHTLDSLDFNLPITVPGPYLANMVTWVYADHVLAIFAPKVLRSRRQRR